jgi:hypothetical protein
MATDPVDNPFAFIQEEAPGSLAGRRPRRSSVYRRIGIGFAFISVDLAIIACVLHLLGVIAVPGLPAMDNGRPNAATKTLAPERPTRSAVGSSPVVAKLVASRKMVHENRPQLADATEPGASGLPALREPSAEEVLEGEGLKKSGTGYVFSDDEDLQKRIAKAVILFKEAKAAFEHLKPAAHGFQGLTDAVASREAERIDLEAAIARQQEYVNGLPRVANVEKAAHDEANGALMVMRARLTEVRRQLDHGRWELPGMTQQRDAVVRIYKSKRAEFLSEGRRLERAIDSRIEDYQSLAKHIKIQQALETVSRTSGKNLALRPSQELLKHRDELKKALKIVESASAPQP